MENQDQNIKTENEQIIPKTKPKKRKKKTVSDIELQIKELQKKKEELILKSKADIGDFVLSTLSKNAGSINCTDEILIDILIDAPIRSLISFTARHDCLMIHSPIVIIYPFSSATVINFSGLT